MQHLDSKYPLGVYRFLASYMPTLASVGAFSFFINLLALSGAIYMLQVYDRVLTSMSVPTLIGLSVILVILYAISGTLEIVRARIMSRVGTELDANLSPQVFAAVVKRAVAKRDPGDGLQPVRDLDQIRSFMSGMGPIALFDLPWMPLFLIFVYLLHPMIALVAVIGMVLLLLLTLVTEVRSADPLRTAAQAGGQRLALAETVRRNSDSVQAMGFAGALSGRYQALSQNYLAEQLRASDIIGSVGNITKVVRLMLQSGVLGLGAYLVIQGELTAGGIIAASITVARALAPIEQAVTQWRGFINARQSAARLGHFLASATVAEEQRIELPAPKNTLKVERLTLMPPGLNTPILRGVGFDLQSGDGLGIIGPSGSGKTSLGRALVGLWKAANPDGAVRLDNAALGQWDSAQLGRHIGYMPQDVELMPGTIAENISRFSPDATSEAIVKAAKTAGAHDLIVRLSDGYQTLIGEGGRMLSGGERQRIALARALYGDPFLIVLDEPNANLDSDGDAALTQAILSVRRRGGIAIVIAHRPSALAGANKVLVMTEGQVRAFGARDEILKSVMQSVPGAAAAAKTLPRSEPKEQSS